MAVTQTHPNHYYYQLGKGNIDLSADSLKVILLDSAFAFNIDTHATLADVTANQLATGNGYTQDNKTITGNTWTENDSTNKGEFSCNAVTFTAVAGSIGPFGAAIIYDDTTADDTVIACIDYGTDFTILDGESFKISAIVINIGGV